MDTYRNRVAATLGLAAILGLTACGGAGNTISSNTPSPGETQAAVTHAAQATVAQFGQTVTFPDGVQATVTAKVQPAGQYASGAVDGQITVVAVVLTNGSNQAAQVALTSYPAVTYGTQGVSAPIASDFQNLSGQSTIGNLLPGETQTAVTGWGVPADGLSTVRVELMAPDLSGQPAVFKGAVK